MAFEDYRGAMFGPTWKASARQFGVIAASDVRIPMSDGVALSCNLWRPDGAARVPAIRNRPGTLIGLFFIGYGLARSTVEFFREPDAQLGFLFAGATMGQLLSLPMIGIGIGLVLYARSRPVTVETAATADPDRSPAP